MKSAVALLLIVIAVSISGCSTVSKLSLAAQKDSEELILVFPSKHINGLLSFRLWQADTRQLLWHVKLNYYRGETLRYGEIPENFTTFIGNTASARQEFPAEGRPPAKLPANQRLIAEAMVQYDTLLSASGTVISLLITTDETGAVISTESIKTMDRFNNPSTGPKPAPQASAGVDSSG